MVESKERHNTSTLPPISTSLSQVLEIASQNESGSVGLVDVLAVIALNRSGSRKKGADIIEACLIGQDRPGFRRKIERLMSERGMVDMEPRSVEVLRFKPETIELINEARNYSDGPIGTDDLIMAEMSRKSSILRYLMSQSGISITNHDRQINMISANLGGGETGSVSRAYVLMERQARNEVVRGDLKVENLVAESRTENGRDLVKRARQGEFNNVLIRGEWISNVLHSLSAQRMTVMIAEHPEIAFGIVNGLAKQISADEKGALGFKRVMAIDSVDLAVNPNVEIIAAINECGRGGILYFPNAHQYLRETSEAGARLRQAVSRKQIKLLTAVNEDQWHAIYKRDEFSGVKPLFLEAPSVDETVAILTTNKAGLEEELGNDMGIKISDEAILAAARLADRYYRDVAPPVGAEELLRRAAMEIRVAMAGLDGIVDRRFKSDSSIDEEDVQMALEKLTGIKLTVESPEKYLKMEDKLREGIIGQDEALTAVADTIRRAKAGFHDAKRPIGSFLFMGPSGVGKTELATVLADFMFDGDQKALITIDMGEYGEKHAVGRLVGAPPGYIGYEEGGQLTEAVRKQPYSIVLFDEVEKADPDVLKVLLQILEEGRLTDGHGRTVSFNNTVVIMTGNVGSEYYQIEGEMATRVGKERALEAIKAQVQESIKGTFRPEFLNRIDCQIIFNSLTPEDIGKIVAIQMRKVNKNLEDKGIEIELSDEARDVVAREGYDPQYGARPLRRAIQTLIEAPLSNRILSGKVEKGAKIAVGVDETGLTFDN